MGRLTRARYAQAGAAFGLTALLVLALLWGLDLGATHPALAALVTLLFTVNAAALSGAAMTALSGLAPPRTFRATTDVAAAGSPGPCAVLWMVCGEDPALIASRLRDLVAGLEHTGQLRDVTVFVLSDTACPDALSAERAMLAPLGDRIRYRNRPVPVGRKPGNLRDWLGQYGAEYDTMLVLDADSGFSADRLAAMRAQMQADPSLGILQAAIRLRPGRSRFGGLQRLSARLCGPVFARGLARLSGDAGNFWGHNALIRTRAFVQAGLVPDLPGRAPWGGPILSHDFIEAAFLRRAGWSVRIDADTRGSLEDAPQTIVAHLRRDRRWAQGNLQHLRLIAAPGLHPASRLHMAAGIQSYLSAPIWLALVLLFGSGAVHATAGALVPLGAMLALLMVPKLAGVWAQYGRLRTRRRRALIWRAFGAEVALSTLFAPLAMVHRTGFVAAILMGRDSGWQPSGAVGARRISGVPGVGSAGAIAAGVAIMAGVMTPQAVIGQGMGVALLAGAMVLPVTIPLLVAPWLVRWFDADRVRAPAADTAAIQRYYDASTRRFLAMGGSGLALAIHRPLWGAGASTPEAAAAHVNTLVARAAEDALGAPPATIRDLGCGVGGTLFHLASLWPDARLSGMTLSAAQVGMARAHARARGLSSRVEITQSDFMLPTTLPQVDLVLAIESHVHADSAENFLRAAFAHLRPGGVLIVVDDMLADDRAPLDPTDARLIDTFRRGWHLGHVPTAAALLAEAGQQGYATLSIQDLTPMLRLDRLRDRLLRLAGPLADRLGLWHIAVFSNMIGGNALTQSYRVGLMRYRLVVLQRPEVLHHVTCPARAGQDAA